jgi:hypothetical protein
VLQPLFVIPAGAVAGTRSYTYSNLSLGSTCTVTETADGDNASVVVTVTGSGSIVTIPQSGVLVYIRKLYERQEFRFAGPYRDKGFLEDYTAWVRGEPIGNVVQIFRNDAGQTQHIVGNYRPRSTVLLLSRLVGEHFAGTPFGDHFATGGD